MMSFIAENQARVDQGRKVKVHLFRGSSRISYCEECKLLWVAFCRLIFVTFSPFFSLQAPASAEEEASDSASSSEVEE